jgi:hypothetical protein
MVGLGGVEPPTSRLSGVRSNHLSYRPIKGKYFAVSSYFQLINSLTYKKRIRIKVYATLTDFLPRLPGTVPKVTLPSLVAKIV